MAEVAGGIECFDDLLEGEVLMCLRGQGGLADLGQQCGDGWIVAQVDLQGLGVGEQTDQRFQFVARAIGDGGADDEACLIGTARQHARPARQQGHEQGAAVTQAQCLQRGAQRRIQCEWQCVATVILYRWAWSVGRQIQQGGRVMQVVDPELALAL